MKKKIVYGLLLAGVMMFCVGGCGKDEVVQNPTEVVEPSESEKPESQLHMVPGEVRCLWF